jgi:hypothetical protein
MSQERYSLDGLARQLAVDSNLLLALAQDPGTHYQPFFSIQRDKKPRLIDNPDEALKLVQRRIRETLLAPLPLPDHVTGCVKGCSPLKNASRHLGSSNVASVDVKNFYPSITSNAVFRFWRRQGFGQRLASLLTKLTTRGGHLPQGAPTSDALANHILSPIDDEIERLAKELDLSPSRYLDNIDLSGHRAVEAIAPLVKAIQREGLAVRHKKVFNARRSRRQTVTGFTVNSGERPSIARKAQRQVRAAAHQLMQIKKKGLTDPRLENSLRGRIAHLRVTNPGAARRVEALLSGK